jgi:beta-phosphoglucomutase
MLRAVIFDMDGVIVDSHPAHKKAWQKFLELQNRNVSNDDLNFIMEGRKREEILKHFLGEVSDEQLRILGHQKEQIFREEAVHVKVIGGLCDFLQELDDAKIRLAVASSGSNGRVNDILNSLGLRRYFQVVVTGDQVTYGKPDPAIFRLTCEYVGVQPSEVLVFEDSVSGVRAAKSAGIRCIGVASNGVIPTLLEAGAEQIIPDFTNIQFEQMRSLFH